MESNAFDVLTLERTIKDQFGASLDIHTIILERANVSRSAQATVFLTTKKQLYVYIHQTTKLLLGDVQKIISRMGLRAELYLPPKGQPHYFDDIGIAKFKDVFPGRRNLSGDDILFYRTLAPYCPSLVVIEEVRDGHIYCYDSDARKDWRPAAKFAYRRIKTS